MDDEDTVLSSVSIESSRFAAVGDDIRPRGPDGEIVDLQGRTVIPGPIDNHIHFLRTGLLPGHDMRVLETAFSIADASAVIEARARIVPGGELLSAPGGIHPGQFAERRYPTVADLDDAAPDRPVCLSISIRGPGVTDTLAGQLPREHGTPVRDDGIVARGKDTIAAWEALSAGSKPPPRSTSSAATSDNSNAELSSMEQEARLRRPGRPAVHTRRPAHPIGKSNRFDEKVILDLRGSLPPISSSTRGRATWDPIGGTSRGGGASRRRPTPGGDAAALRGA